MRFETADASAKAGVKYTKVSGKLTFEAGQSLQQISVTMMSDDNWDATTEFQIFLKEPQGTDLGKYLDNCRVKIIDDDAFPTNRFRDLLQSQQCDQVPHWPLLIEYIKFNYSDHTVRAGTWKVLMVDQLHNLFFIHNIYLSWYMVDKVLSKKGQENPQDTYTGEPESTLFLIMVWMILPLFLLHWLDYKKCFWKVGGTSRKKLQANLLRKFLNYDEDSRSGIQSSDLIMAMTRDAPDLFSHGYASVFKLVKSIGKLVMVIIYQLTGNPAGILPMLVFPILMAAYLMVRSGKTARAGDAEQDAQNDLVTCVEQSVSRYRLIADYNRRPKFIASLEAAIGKLNKAMVQNAAVTVNNKYFAPWMKTVILGLWVYVGGSWVLSGDMALADYLATAKIFKAVGDSFLEMYQTMLVMQSVIPGLLMVVTLMNLPVDVEPRMRMNRERRRLGEEARQHEREMALNAASESNTNKGVIAADKVPLRMDDVTFAYHHKAGSQDSTGLHNCTGEFPQGKFVCVVGPRGEGKSTLMRLLGGVLLPQSGLIFIPPWLRVLHASHDPLFFHGSLADNLTFGVNEDDKEDSDVKRILSICTRLGLKERVLNALKSNEVEDWDVVMSRTQKGLLNVARALVANAEVLVMHTPTAGLDRTNCTRVNEFLREYVDGKGVEQDPAGISKRRPRTLIVSASTIDDLKSADNVFVVREHRVHEVRKADVDEKMLC